MVEFNYKYDYTLEDEAKFARWIERICHSEKKICGDIIFTFCDDSYLDKLNKEYLNHTDFTDIISFDDSIGEIISGDIFISLDRIGENALKYKVSFSEELLRVMAHGVLHFCGYEDFEEEDIKLMREKENEKIKLFHVEQS